MQEINEKFSVGWPPFDSGCCSSSTSKSPEAWKTQNYKNHQINTTSELEKTKQWKNSTKIQQFEVKFIATKQTINQSVTIRWWKMIAQIWEMKIGNRLGELHTFPKEERNGCWWSELMEAIFIVFFEMVWNNRQGVGRKRNILFYFFDFFGYFGYLKKHHVYSRDSWGKIRIRLIFLLTICF